MGINCAKSQTATTYLDEWPCQAAEPLSASMFSSIKWEHWCPSLVGFPWRLNEVMHVKHLKPCLAQDKYHINICYSFYHHLPDSHGGQSSQASGSTVSPWTAVDVRGGSSSPGSPSHLPDREQDSLPLGSSVSLSWKIGAETNLSLKPRQARNCWWVPDLCSSTDRYEEQRTLLSPHKQGRAEHRLLLEGGVALLLRPLPPSLTHRPQTC